MSRRPSIQAELTRTLKAARAAGLDPARVEIIDDQPRRTVLYFGAGEAVPLSDYDKWKAGRAG